MPRFVTRVGLVTAIVLACSSLPFRAFAQAMDVEVALPEPSEKKFVIHSGYDHVFETRVDNTGGADMSLDSFLIGAGGRFDIADNLTLSALFHYELDAYDFTEGLDVLAWEDINQFTLAGLLDYELDEHWHVLGGPIFRLAGEGSAVFDDAFTGGGLIGFTYLASKDLTVGLALGLLSQIEDDPAIMPVPIVRWHFAEPLTLKVGISPLGGRTGLGPELIWHVAEQIDVGAGLQYQRRRFRLDDSEALATRDGVGEDTSLPIYARLTWRPIPAAAIEVFGGVVTAGEVTLADDRGHNHVDNDYDATGTLGMRAEYRF
jgi:hypothetical protein